MDELMHGGSDEVPGHEDPDDELHVLFERARAPLDAQPFIEQFERRLCAARRSARVRAATIVLLGALLAAAIVLLAAPYVARLCVSLGTYVQGGVPSLTDALASPAGWAVSIVLAAWVLRRSGVFGR
jgi:hypothetical protein